jgi:hypothetical protein
VQKTGEDEIISLSEVLGKNITLLGASAGIASAPAAGASPGVAITTQKVSENQRTRGFFIMETRGK